MAALETVLALADLGRDRTDVTVIAPNTEFVYRPMVVREPFAHGAARRYPLAPIVRDAGATLLHGELGWIDPVERTIHTKADEAIEYDALVLALGASISKRYKHALTIDDRDLDETMHGLIQDVEGDFIHKLAFVAPGRMAWPLPLYELALMTAGRAYDMGIDLETTIVTPEDSPLAIFGASASSSITELLARASIETITSAYAEVPNSREVVINPGDRHLEVDRVIALPELFGPEVRGIPLGEHGFIRVDPYCRVPGIEHIYAAGDATDFPIKHGGIGSQQADIAAQSIAALAGAVGYARALQPRDTRHAVDGREASIPHRSHHRRTRVQLGDHRHTNMVAAEQDRRQVPCAVSTGARPRKHPDLREVSRFARHPSPYLRQFTPAPSEAP